MRTWEMIKELTENPKKKFKSSVTGEEIGIIGGVLVWIDSDEYFRIFHDLNIDNLINIEWEEVKEPPRPVDFMTAIRKLYEGHNIYGIVQQHEHIEPIKVYLKHESLNKSAYEHIPLVAIMHGEWYIE